MSYAEQDGFVHDRFETFDGLEIAYQVQTRDGDAAGAPLCLTNGLGGSYKAWGPFVECLGGRRRLFTWDYRGLYRSARPSDPSTLRVETQCEDMVRLFDHLAVDRAVLLGWSMGVQVNFEFFDRFPERVAGIVAINGTSGRPFDTAFRAGVLRRALPAIATGLKYSGPVLSPFMGRWASRWVSMKAVQAVGLMADTVDFHQWEELAGDFAELDLDTYFETLRLLGEHDVSHALPRIDVPVLVVGGSHDILTPAWVSRRVASEVPRAELLIARGGTHYVPLEFPELLALRVDKFLNERIAAPAASSKGATRRKRATA